MNLRDLFLRAMSGPRQAQPVARDVVIVTERGVELPLARAYGWDVLTLARLTAQIDRLPETPERVR